VNHIPTTEWCCRRHHRKNFWFERKLRIRTTTTR
jgi:hypothetical protein